MVMGSVFGGCGDETKLSCKNYYECLPRIRTPNRDGIIWELQPSSGVVTPQDPATDWPLGMQNTNRVCVERRTPEGVVADSHIW